MTCEPAGDGGEQFRGRLLQAAFQLGEVLRRHPGASGDVDDPVRPFQPLGAQLLARGQGKPAHVAAFDQQVGHMLLEADLAAERFDLGAESREVEPARDRARFEVSLFYPSAIEDDVTAALRRTNGYAPVTGTMKWDEKGEQRYAAVGVYELRRGSWELRMRSDRW